MTIAVCYKAIMLPGCIQSRCCRGFPVHVHFCWIKVMLAAHVQVSASSPGCRHTDAKALVSGGFLRHNAAGPPTGAAGGGGGGGAWWQLDLGARHRLACNHYTLRHDASPAFPRSWALQARGRACTPESLKALLRPTT